MLGGFSNNVLEKYAALPSRYQFLVSGRLRLQIVL
jgi:hypothetical protein